LSENAVDSVWLFPLLSRWNALALRKPWTEQFKPCSIAATCEVVAEAIRECRTQ